MFGPKTYPDDCGWIHPTRYCVARVLRWLMRPKGFDATGCRGCSLLAWQQTRERPWIERYLLTNRPYPCPVIAQQDGPYV